MVLLWTLLRTKISKPSKKLADLLRLRQSDSRLNSMSELISSSAALWLTWRATTRRLIMRVALISIAAAAALDSRHFRAEPEQSFDCFARAWNHSSNGGPDRKSGLLPLGAGSAIAGILGAAAVGIGRGYELARRLWWLARRRLAWRRLAWRRMARRRLAWRRLAWRRIGTAAASMAVVASTAASMAVAAAGERGAQVRFVVFARRRRGFPASSRTPRGVRDQAHNRPIRPRQLVHLICAPKKAQ